MSFRQKLIISYFAVSLLFLALMFPLAGRFVRHILISSLVKQTGEVIEAVATAPDLDAMIDRLDTLQHYLFFRVTLFNDSGKILYESRDEGPDPDLSQLTSHPEVKQAVLHGRGYSEHYSYLLGQDLAYVALPFLFQGETLVLRTAFPLSEVDHLIDDFRIGMLMLGGILLLLFAVLTALVTYHFTRPIKSIIQMIKPYQEGTVESLPEIELPYRSSEKDEFNRLATTLNSLNNRIEQQISTLKKERNERAAILEALTEGVVAVDRDLRMLYANEAAVVFLGLDEEEWAGSRFPMEQTELVNLLKASQGKGEILQETIQMGSDPKPTYFDITAVPQGVGNGALLILQNQTHHYALLEMRKDFIANASHELKTPLTIIHGFAETLNEQPEMGIDLIQTVTSKIISNCHRMEQLVKNLLRMADVEHLPLSNLERIDLSSFLEECRSMTLSIYPESTVTLHLPDDKIDLWADAELFELAVTNLLYNAAKYSKAPAEIDLFVADLGDTIEIKVADHGIGIPEVDLPSIFQRFYTVDKAHSRQMGGSGLGLSIVETIIHKHFGEISVESKLGVGTTFTIRLPRKLNELLATSNEAL